MNLKKGRFSALMCIEICSSPQSAHNMKLFSLLFIWACNFNSFNKFHSNAKESFSLPSPAPENVFWGCCVRWWPLLIAESYHHSLLHFCIGQEQLRNKSWRLLNRNNMSNTFSFVVTFYINQYFEIPIAQILKQALFFLDFILFCNELHATLCP